MTTTETATRPRVLLTFDGVPLLPGLLVQQRTMGGYINESMVGEVGGVHQDDAAREAGQLQWCVQVKWAADDFTTCEREYQLVALDPRKVLLP